MRRIAYWAAYLGTVLLVTATFTQAGLINRPTKTCGTTTYTDEVANGCPTILAAEVDADFNTIYGEFNGQITNDNIASGANINCAKLAANSCTSTVIQTGAICSTQIGDGCIATVDIADGAITSAKIADGTIATADIANGAVTNPKLADGAVVSTVTSGACTPQVIGTTEAQIVSIAMGSLTTGNVVQLTGLCPLYLADLSNPTTVLGLNTVHFRWKRNGVTQQEFTVPMGVVTVGNVTTAAVVPIAFPNYTDTGIVGPGTYTYGLTAQTSNASMTLTVSSVGSNVLNGLVLK